MQHPTDYTADYIGKVMTLKISLNMATGRSSASITHAQGMIEEVYIALLFTPSNHGKNLFLGLGSFRCSLNVVPS